MRDQRADALAKILVQHSTKVGKGDVCVIQATTAAESLALAVYEEILRAGGHAVFNMSPEDAQASFFDLAVDDQLDWVAPTAKWAVEEADVRIALMADTNTRALSHVAAVEAAARPEGAQAADGDLDGAAPRRASTAGR